MKAYKLNENTIKYTLGNPINTEAVVVEGKEIHKDTIDFFSINNAKEDLELTYTMSKDDIVYGLGENQRGINKRGGIYESFCSDDSVHTPDKKSLYGAHNFIVIDGRNRFGVFIDFPGKVIFDIGFSYKSEMKINIEERNANIYIIKGNSLKAIIKGFLNIIGESYVPPKWAFGYQQSRWSYENAKAISKIADKFIENKIPCDAIYLDIDYMESFKDFTVDEKAFPNFKDFVGEIKNKGFRLVPIIDAGVKIEKGYEVYEEGVEKGYFCTDNSGENFVAAVWPGRCHFPDFLNAEARKWFGLKYRKLTDLGIEGFWNDMNEPALFYTNRGLKEAVENAKASEEENLDIYSFFKLKDKFISMSNNIEDYKSFYHKMDGKTINHYKVHNLYGYNMTRSAAEGLKTIEANKRFLLFSRASYIGMHRYSGIWTGDNSSWWEHILLNIKMMVSLNMCGFLYIGADTGGFSCNADSELIIRWTQFSLFTPLFRNHSAMGTRKQEPFSFDEETNRILKKSIELRYALIPYIYSEYMKAVKNKDMYFLPLSFVYEDEMSRRIENQIILGDSLMLSPIYEENAAGRYVYTPEDMLLWKVKDHKQRNYEIVKKGHHYIDIGLEEVPIFIRKNNMLVLGNHAQNVDKLDNKELSIIAFVEDKAEYTYYDDDGKTFDYKNNRYTELFIQIEKKENNYIINLENKGDKCVKQLNFEIVDVNGNINRKSIHFNG